MKAGMRTKKLLLDTACKLFAEKGYHNTTMREITDTSNTNIAAVNYHFGNKENLYFEAFKYAAAIATELANRASAEASAEESLKEILHRRIHSIITKDSGSWLIRMFHHEIPCPTNQHKRIVTEIMVKQRDFIRGEVNRYFGGQLSDAQFGTVFGCIISPMIHQIRHGNPPTHAKHLKEKMFPALPDEQRADLTVKFIMSGLDGLRKELNEK